MASKNGNENGTRPAPFDVIELRADLDGHAAGSRGTVVAEGMLKCLVDFAWGKGPRNVELQEPDLRPVPYGAMKMIAHRPDNGDGVAVAQSGSARSQSR
jgi:hypothetical protein